MAICGCPLNYADIFVCLNVINECICKEYKMTRSDRKSIQITILTVCCLILLTTLGPAAEKFKPFKLKTPEGITKTLPDFANKLTLVAFYYPSCAYCNLAIPEVLKIYDKYKEQGLSYVIINVKPDESKLIAGWTEKYHITVPVLLGVSQDDLMDDYRLTMTPTHYLLGRKNEVLFYQNGYNRGDEKALEAKIMEALDASPDKTGAEKP